METDLVADTFILYKLSITGASTAAAVQWLRMHGECFTSGMKKTTRRGKKSVQRQGNYYAPTFNEQKAPEALKISMLDETETWAAVTKRMASTLHKRVSLLCT